jgi:hypothetical protein
MTIPEDSNAIGISDAANSDNELDKGKKSKNLQIGEAKGDDEKGLDDYLKSAIKDAQAENWPAFASDVFGLISKLVHDITDVLNSPKAQDNWPAFASDVLGLVSKLVHDITGLLNSPKAQDNLSVLVSDVLGLISKLVHDITGVLNPLTAQDNVKSQQNDKIS